MSAAEKIETVSLRDLVPDRCNYKDQAFEKFVGNFMHRWMPGFSIHLLDKDDFERWEIEPEYSLVEDESHYDVEDGYDQYNVLKDDEMIASFETEQEAHDHMDALEALRWEIRGSDGTLVEEHESEGEAEERVHQLNNENMYGFPWANNWCFIPPRDIHTADLKAAGFTVARYVGGKGDWREDITQRLCGIDGGGYSFSGQHFAKLAALVYQRWECKVDTDDGPRYIEV
jgi:hypothetical protein